MTSLRSQLNIRVMSPGWNSETEFLAINIHPRDCLHAIRDRDFNKHVPGRLKGDKFPFLRRFVYPRGLCRKYARFQTIHGIAGLLPSTNPATIKAAEDSRPGKCSSRKRLKRSRDVRCLARRFGDGPAGRRDTSDCHFQSSAAARANISYRRKPTGSLPVRDSVKKSSPRREVAVEKSSAS